MQLLACFSFQGFAQTKEVKILFDSSDAKVKEKYYVLENQPDILSGEYISFYLNGNIKTQGFYENSIAVGTWTYFFENGKKKMNAEIDKDENGDYLTYYYENGIISQEGYLKNGKKSGLWKFYYESGQLKSQGYFEENERDGNWNIYYEDDILKGQAIYKDHEAWYQEFYPSGEKKMEGKIKEGKSDSLWVHYFTDGTIQAKGNEKDGLKEGEWTYFHSNGSIASQGIYKYGLKNGTWKEYYDNGSLNSQGELVQGQKDGFWKLYYRSGASLADGDYHKGTGKYTEFYESGKVKVQGYVKDGKNDSIWNFFYEDGSVEGRCYYQNGEGGYKGYYQDGKLKMAGNLKDGEKTGTWKLYDEKGKLAGLYKTFYGKEEPIVSIAPIKVEKSEEEKPENSGRSSYKFKPKKTIKFFRSRLNEYTSFIVSTNPLQTLFGSFPVSLEYYYQERLGYELKVAWIRNPFYTAKSQVPSDITYQRGFYIELRQKFYFEKNLYGLLYFGQELRYTRSSYGANLSVPIPFFTPVLNEDLFEYSIVFGDRVMESHANKGFTLDFWGGLGIGYRSTSKNWTNIPSVEIAYANVQLNNISVPFRVGFTVGYVLKYNPSPMYNY